MFAKNVMLGVVLTVTCSAQLIKASDTDEQKSATMLVQACTEYLASPKCSALFQKFMTESVRTVRENLKNKGHEDSIKLIDEIIADVHIVREAFREARMKQLARLTSEQREKYINNTLPLEEHTKIYQQGAGASEVTLEHTAQEAMQRLQQRYELLESAGFFNNDHPPREMLNLFEKVIFDVNHTAQ